MEEQIFRDLVRQLRAAQKEFFRKKDQDILKLCKKLEKQVDEELKPPTEQINLVNQIPLF